MSEQSRAVQIRARALTFLDQDAEHRASWLTDPQYVLAIEASIGMLCNIDSNLAVLGWRETERDDLITLVLLRWREDVERDRARRTLAMQTTVSPATLSEFDKPS